MFPIYLDIEKLQNEDERTSNVMSAFSLSGVYIDIYFF